MRPHLERKKLVDTVKKLYGTCSSTAYFLYDKVLAEEKMSFAELIKELENDYEISYTPNPLGENPLPTALLISNEDMKKNFESYGKSIAFDLTFSLFKEKPVEYFDDGEATQFKEYYLGFFTGINNYNKVIIFACVITCKTKKEDVQVMFLDFF